MHSCHSIPECGGLFSDVKLSIRSFVLFTIVDNVHYAKIKSDE